MVQWFNVALAEDTGGPILVSVDIRYAHGTWT